MSSSYSSRTYASPNVLRGYSHRARFRVALNLVAAAAPARLLDYGTGDGHFLALVEEDARYGAVALAGYDPLRPPAGGVVDRVEALAPGFDCITCLEVLEHLTDAQQQVFFQHARQLLRAGGTVLISVPVMLGPAGCLKLFLNALRGGASGGYTVGNALRALVGVPPGRRWVNPSGTYHHPGFDHRVLRRRLHQVFRDVEELASPFPMLPLPLNSQVFFVCRGWR